MLRGVLVKQYAESEQPVRYGTPTLPDGRREELPQRDVPVFAPLSLAIAGVEKPERLAAW